MSDFEDNNDDLNYHDLMGSVGNLRDDDQTNRKRSKENIITPMNGGKSDVNWWNEYPTSNTASNLQSNSPDTKTTNTNPKSASEEHTSYSNQANNKEEPGGCCLIL
ncbi:hypothetical protein M9Y10_025786 [Tritrichomonas musculus]|uniref:Uncharacterized protein n=1 Tax=Tritrichomonas musculus TaxID=1915356 RepID=A0ABR2H9M4_9EUKA